MTVATVSDRPAAAAGVPTGSAAGRVAAVPVRAAGRKAWAGPSILRSGRTGLGVAAGRSALAAGTMPSGPPLVVAVMLVAVVRRSGRGPLGELTALGALAVAEASGAADGADTAGSTTAAAGVGSPAACD